MISDRNVEDFRRWTLAVLGLLGAEPGRQVEYLQASEVEADEILLQFDDLLHVARARVADGSLKNEDYFLIESVNERADALNARPDSIWAFAALNEATEWRDLRVAARITKLSLEQSWSQEFHD